MTLFLHAMFVALITTALNVIPIHAKANPNTDRSSSVQEVKLPMALEKAIKANYASTREKNDCCGISQVKVFKINKKVSLDKSFIALLKLESKRSKDFSDILSVAEMKKDSQKISTASFFAQYVLDINHPEKLTKDQLATIALATKLIGTSELQIFRRAIYEPAPSVDGSIDFAITPDKQFLLMRVNDWGA